MSGFKQPDFLERQVAAAKAKKAALDKFRAKAADPTLADRLTAREASAADRKATKKARAIEKAEKRPAMLNARSRQSVMLSSRPSAPGLKVRSANARWKPSARRPGTPAMPPAKRDRSAVS